MTSRQQRILPRRTTRGSPPDGSCVIDLKNNPSRVEQEDRISWRDAPMWKQKEEVIR